MRRWNGGGLVKRENETATDDHERDESQHGVVGAAGGSNEYFEVIGFGVEDRNERDEAVETPFDPR